MAETIYGIDLSREITPIMVRDVMIECFCGAHKEILDEMKEYSHFECDDDLKKMGRLDVEILIKKFFEETGGDFDNPDKESIIKVSDKLADFSSKFRDTATIREHYGEMMQLIERLK